MASRGHSFSLGSRCSSTALVMLKYAGQMLQRPHLECSLTARTADSATTHSVVQRLHASTPTSPRRLLMQRDASTCQTTCPWAFWTRKPAPPPSVASTVPRTTFATGPAWSRLHSYGHRFENKDRELHRVGHVDTARAHPTAMLMFLQFGSKTSAAITASRLPPKS